MPTGPLPPSNPDQPDQPPGEPNPAPTGRLRWVLTHFNGVKPSRDGWVALCPAHDDRNPSLSVSQAGNGRVLVHCHAGCPFADVLAAAGLSPADLFPGNPVIDATYDYRAEDGHLLYQVVRMDPKGFRQRIPDGQGGWQWKLGDVRRVLYRLPELLAADPSTPVFYPEGEKDVDRLVAVGLVATTHAGGAGKWRPEFAESLRGRHVVVLPDNDTPGRVGARKVCEALWELPWSSTSRERLCEAVHRAGQRRRIPRDLPRDP